jgi:hypothetical protein
MSAGIKALDPHHMVTTGTEVRIGVRHAHALAGSA